MVLYDQSNEEEGIWKTQTKAIRKELEKPDGLRTQHEKGIQYLDQRIHNYLFAIVYLVIFTVLVVSTSLLVFISMFTMLVLVTLVWGVSKIQKIQIMKKQREDQMRQVNKNHDR